MHKLEQLRNWCSFYPKAWSVGQHRSYACGTLRNAEQKYSTSDQWGLAVLSAISKFRLNILGSPFVVATHYHSLCLLLPVKDPREPLVNMVLKTVAVIYDDTQEVGEKRLRCWLSIRDLRHSAVDLNDSTLTVAPITSAGYENSAFFEE